jgi:hypothetical protein
MKKSELIKTIDIIEQQLRDMLPHARKENDWAPYYDKKGELERMYSLMKHGFYDD